MSFPTPCRPPYPCSGKPLAQFEDIAKTEEERFKNVAVAGLVSAGVEARIVDSEDFTRRLPHDGKAQGELLVRGPWVTTRYYKIDKPEAFVSPGGWLATGDIASIDPRGNLIIRDRSKDVIKVIFFFPPLFLGLIPASFLLLVLCSTAFSLVVPATPCSLCRRRRRWSLCPYHHGFYLRINFNR